MTIADEGILYRNPVPGCKAECAYQPNLVWLSEREIVCTYRIGQAFYSTDGVLMQLRSTDGGGTWVAEGKIDSLSDSKHLYNYAAPKVARLKNGVLLLVAKRWKAKDQRPHVINPTTGGMIPSEQVLLRSSDGGQSWSSPEVLDLPGDGLADVPSQIIELQDGRWFLGCELWKAWDDRAPLHIRGFGVFSEDGGRSWGDRVDFPSAVDSEKMYSHSRYTPMLDGRICALQWTQSIGASRDFDLHFTISDKTGEIWEHPRATGIPGQTSWVADLGDRLLAAVYCTREGMKPGISVALSEDMGKTWNLSNEVMVWDAVGQEYLGVAHKPDYPASHSNIAFGKPNIIRLDEKTLLTAWWCTQAAVTHIRCAKLAVQ